MLTDLIGWFSASVLLLTMMRQVYVQWRTTSVQGVSKYLFIGQVITSVGFTVYSYMVSNWVFVTTNVFMLFNALLGQWIYQRNKKMHPGKTAD